MSAKGKVIVPRKSNTPTHPRFVVCPTCRGSKIIPVGESVAADLDTRIGLRNARVLGEMMREMAALSNDLKRGLTVIHSDAEIAAAVRVVLRKHLLSPVSASSSQGKESGT